jgi:hypothetical protein
MILIKSLLLFILLSSVTHAAVVTVNYSGTINGKGGLSSDLHTLMPIGQTFTGSYTYDSSFSATSSSSINDISYTGAISDFTVNVGALYATLDNGAFRYINNKEIPPYPPEIEPTFYDTYIVQGRTDHTSLPTNVDTNIVLSNYVSETLTSGYHLRWLRLDITDTTAEILNSALLTDGIPDISGQNMRFEFGYQLDCCTGRTDVYGVIDSLTISSVPVPQAIWLFVTGIASLISFTKYNNRQNS